MKAFVLLPLLALLLVNLGTGGHSKHLINENSPRRRGDTITLPAGDCSFAPGRAIVSLFNTSALTKPCSSQNSITVASIFTATSDFASSTPNTSNTASINNYASDTSRNNYASDTSRSTEAASTSPTADATTSDPPTKVKSVATTTSVSDTPTPDSPTSSAATTSTLGSLTSTSPISDTSTVSTSSPMPSSTIDTTESSTSNSPSTGSTPSVSATQNTSATPFTTTLGYSTSSETNTPNTGATGSSTLCQADTCGSSASCINLHTEHICLCTEGYYYSNRTCNRGKTFPGDISVLVSETTDLKNETSSNYQDLHTKVTTFFADAFNSTDYYQTVILKVSIPSSRSASSEVRASGKTVTVSVVNIFAQNTSENETSIAEIIEEAIKQNINFSAYFGQDRCDYYGCVKNADGCSNGLDCDCKAGLQRPNVQSPFCLAVECPEECNAEHRKQCLKEDSQTLKCTCLPGYQTDDQGNCKECPFGYSGVDCKDQFKLILTIVGTIAGILILSLVITLIFSTRSKNKKYTEEQKLIENDYQNLQLQQTGFINLGASGASNGNLFPKVRTSTSRNTPAQNPYANQRGMPHPDY